MWALRLCPRPLNQNLHLDKMPRGTVCSLESEQRRSWQSRLPGGLLTEGCPKPRSVSVGGSQRICISQLGMGRGRGYWPQDYAWHHCLDHWSSTSFSHQNHLGNVDELHTLGPSPRPAGRRASRAGAQAGTALQVSRPRPGTHKLRWRRGEGRCGQCRGSQPLSCPNTLTSAPSGEDWDFRLSEVGRRKAFKRLQGNCNKVARRLNQGSLQVASSLASWSPSCD